MKIRKSFVASCLTAAFLTIAAPSSWAASSWDINFNSECTMNSAAPSNSSYYQSAACSDTSGSNSGIGSTATGWTTAPNTSSSASFTQSYLGRWSGGLGVEIASSPNHAVDNYGGTDLIELDFGSTEVMLNSVTSGWYQTDSDISVLAYTGGGTASVSGTGLSSMTTTGGWTLVGHYANVNSQLNSTVILNNSTITSSWWLISAYNSAYGSAPLQGTNTTTGTDYFKLLAVAGTYELPPPPSISVPEPGSLALAGFGLIAAVGFRRRQQARLAA